MKALIAILILVGVFLLGKELVLKYQSVKRGESTIEPASGRSSGQGGSANLSGLPESLEFALQQAQRQGAEGLANFLRQYRYALQDPRLAAIELDYVVLVSLKDPAEAKRVFKSVQARTFTSSPVYERVKGLEKTYQ